MLFINLPQRCGDLVAVELLSSLHLLCERQTVRIMRLRTRAVQTTLPGCALAREMQPRLPLLPLCKHLTSCMEAPVEVASGVRAPHLKCGVAVQDG
jgi:hypothetical protein